MTDPTPFGRPTLATPLPEATALLLVDLQQAIDDPAWGRRGQPEAEAIAARLLAAWRAAGRPVIHVRHDSTEPASPYRPDRSGNAFKFEVAPAPGEAIVAKTTNSAFIGTDLDARLRSAGIGALVVGGVLLENSVEATVRMSGNLGWRTVLAADATASIDRTDWTGRRWSAEDVHALTLALLDGEYAEVAPADTVLAALR